VEICFEYDPPIPVEFSFEMTSQDYAYIRWYLESFLQYPMDSAPEIARRVEGRMHEIGVELYEKIFGRHDAIKLWGRLRQAGLGSVRVEIVSGAHDVVAIPWELLRDPDTNTPLALDALAFVRSPVTPSRPSHLFNAAPGKMRILLVICRPGGDDIPFRSVAGKLLKGFSERARERYELTLLRPPSFAALTDVLRQAKAEGRPFHIVHFDGHGAYLKLKDAGAAAGAPGGRISLATTGGADSANGYLLFENADLKDNIELVDGTSLGKVLKDMDVPILVLNACRSMHADIQRQPQAGAESHETLRAYSSLAQEVMDAGVPGVVAMRYNVYVMTAAQFMSDLYMALSGGAALGEAVSRGRKRLAAGAVRTIAFDPIRLQDWSVPIVYEGTPLHLFPQNAVEGLKLKVESSVSDLHPSSFILHPSFFDLPPAPDADFFGRDETLLAIDRTFDRNSIVLLHAYAGQGKTATAAEFARWYAATGGLSSPARGGRVPEVEPRAGAEVVLFTSFEQHTPLSRALDAIGKGFGKVLEQCGIQWLALDDNQRTEVALQMLAQIPVLWVWDNVETVAGFPTGSDSPWSQDEQDELALFLHKSRETKAKFLLTSRRDERGWLGDLPTRVTLPPMPMQERLQLARALAARHHHRITDVEDWLSLLALTQGNPLTITVLVRQTLQNGFKHRPQIEAFVEQLHAGQIRLDIWNEGGFVA
jgi:hypothetical protein